MLYFLTEVICVLKPNTLSLSTKILTQKITMKTMNLTKLTLATTLAFALFLTACNNNEPDKPSNEPPIDQPPTERPISGQTRTIRASSAIPSYEETTKIFNQARDYMENEGHSVRIRGMSTLNANSNETEKLQAIRDANYARRPGVSLVVELDGINPYGGGSINLGRGFWNQVTVRSIPNNPAAMTQHLRNTGGQIIVPAGLHVNDDGTEVHFPGSIPAHSYVTLLNQGQSAAEDVRNRARNDNGSSTNFSTDSIRLDRRGIHRDTDDYRYGNTRGFVFSVFRTRYVVGRDRDAEGVVIDWAPEYIISNIRRNGGRSRFLNTRISNFTFIDPMSLRGIEYPGHNNPDHVLSFDDVPRIPYIRASTDSLCLTIDAPEIHRLQLATEDGRPRVIRPSDWQTELWSYNREYNIVLIAPAGKDTVIGDRTFRIIDPSKVITLTQTLGAGGNRTRYTFDRDVLKKLPSPEEFSEINVLDHLTPEQNWSSYFSRTNGSRIHSSSFSLSNGFPDLPHQPSQIYIKIVPGTMLNLDKRDEILRL